MLSRRTKVGSCFGIHAGITILSAESVRTGFVWGTFMKNPEAKRGRERAGFHPGGSLQNNPLDRK